MTTRLLWSYALGFSRLSLAVVFAVSSVGKLWHFSAFRQATSDFRILPGRLAGWAPYLFLCAEVSIVVSMVVGHRLLAPGFFLAVALLTAFSLALLSVLLRGISTSCNCFGPEQRRVSHHDIIRNIGFIAWGVAGWAALSQLHDAKAYLGPHEWIVIGIVAVPYTLLWIRIGELVDMLRSLPWRED